MTMPFHTATACLFAIASASVLAQQPMTLPYRSQNGGQQAVDTAACYAEANQKTHVVMARESQAPAPLKDQAKATPRVALLPQPLQPPLPGAASGASATMPGSAPLAASAAAGASSAQAAKGASGAQVAMPASGASGTLAAMPASGASGALAASAAAASGASGTQVAGMPAGPVPPPEPPMVGYWRAYSTCMQGRGYYVR